MESREAAINAITEKWKLRYIHRMATDTYFVGSSPPEPEELGSELGLTPEHVNSVIRIMNLPILI